MITLENKFLKPPLAHIMGFKRLIQTCLMSNSIKRKRKNIYIKTHFTIKNEIEKNKVLSL